MSVSVVWPVYVGTKQCRRAVMCLGIYIATDVQFSGGSNFYVNEDYGSLNLCLNSMVTEERAGFLYYRPISSK